MLTLSFNKILKNLYILYCWNLYTTQLCIIIVNQIVKKYFDLYKRAKVKIYFLYINS